MGVPTVWDILAPAEEKGVKISSLSGKTVAVDISVWITELKNTPNAQKVPSIYIKNLYYRLLEFLREGVKLVIVIDGRAPALKHDALQSRQVAQFGAASGTFNPDRPMLAKSVQNCVELFQSLGLSCVHAEGEGEATCAHLEATKIVDGCVSEDSDFFCYGGKTLYRNLRKKNRVYVVDKVSGLETKVRLGRRDMVALALLMGCDYSKKGVESVGKEKAKELVKYLKSKHLDVLERLVGWRDNKELFSIETQMSEKVKNQSHCSRCDHLGKISVHQGTGCSVCRTERDCIQSCDQVCQCDWHKQKRLQDENKLEIKIRRRSLQNPDFPDPKIIDEFLRDRGDHSIRFDQIAVPRLIKFLRSLFNWGTSEVQDKVVPCFILQQLWDPQLYKTKMFHPIRINRHCKDRVVDCYEVSWDKADVNSWADEAHSTSVLVKIEKSLFERSYPDMVKRYEEDRISRKSSKSKGKKRKVDTGGETSQRKLTDFTSIKRKLNYNSKVEPVKVEPINRVPSIDKHDKYKEIDAVENCGDGTAGANKESKVSGVSFDDVRPSSSSTQEAGTSFTSLLLAKKSTVRGESGGIEVIEIGEETGDPERKGTLLSSHQQGKSVSQAATVVFSKSSSGMFKEVDRNKSKVRSKVSNGTKEKERSSQASLKDFFQIVKTKNS